MLKLRSHGTNDYSVLEGGRRIGRIRFVIEGMPGVWLWAVTVPLSGGLPTGSASDFNTAKAEYKAAWKALKASTTPEQLASAYEAMNIRNDDDEWKPSPGQGWRVVTASHNILQGTG